MMQNAKQTTTSLKAPIPDFEKLLKEMIQQQKETLLTCARRIVPHVIQDDLLQPQDFPELDCNPDFRFEEGVLVGLEQALQALRTESVFIASK